MLYSVGSISRRFIALTLALLIVTFAGAPAPAQAHGSVCQYLNGLPSYFILAPFAAGDQITVYAYKALGSPSTVTLYVNGKSVATSSVPGSMSYTVPKSQLYLINLIPNKGLVKGSWFCGTPGAPTTNAGSKAGPPAMNLFDGRINNLQNRDVAAPIAIYEGSIKIYGIDPESGDGWLAVNISDAAIEAMGIPTDAPVLLAQGKNQYTGIDIFVYRLPTGEFQVNTHYADGKPYIFVWDEVGDKYHLAW